MPVHKVGKKGYKWGSKGKVYKSKKKALKQGVAITLSKKRHRRS